ncbi:3-phosphoserine/phosphohydroxythreonine transaminase [Alicyclobacillus sp. SO9]|uniref:3-phosphoserine/phosphohydroxythreonine transaminase n=1 Tax=Alicyclobacillus sp. SO9 TaxID=2665646 RepID=UPI0018E7B624|nr:3-phosphoserine/phosphohydroxythreonine transaminase [Alicyclobacillus sp. SO9]QQE80675.1 3-phosphoserine/phosphohydroxythreonine transaminase [Alicyclobacillus sp. SO9]
MSHPARVDNFGAGPAVLPESVLLEVQEELLNYRQSGMSVMEMSHRGKAYEEIQEEAEARLRRLLQVSDEYEVLFLQGGASLQFAMLPLNFRGEGSEAAYVLSGSWANKAMQEAETTGRVRIAGSSKEQGFRSIPTQWNTKESDAYVHITTNNTIYGTQWRQLPEKQSVPLVADMSSDMLSRPFAMTNFDMVYGGAQKNLGPAGVTLVLLRREWVQQAVMEEVPKVMRYATHISGKSRYNTPPVFSVYVLGKVLKWLESMGGLRGIEQLNEDKAGTLYTAIDKSEGFYRGYAQASSRSRMNVTFNLASDELEQKFLREAAESGFVGLSGHRSVGGCRASIYNALSLEACSRLAEFMQTFRKNN